MIIENERDRIPNERDRIPEALPEVERLPELGNVADDADDDVAPDAKPLAGQGPG